MIENKHKIDNNSFKKPKMNNDVHAVLFYLISYSIQIYKRLISPRKPLITTDARQYFYLME